MKWRVHTVGKPALAYARLGAEEYLRRVRRYVPCVHGLMRRGDSDEIGALMAAGKAGSLNVVLDERGQSVTSEQLAGLLAQWQIDAVKTVQVFIGGADGIPEAARRQADHVWQLSALTLQHELALVVFLEQLYRGYTILRGEPYHR